MTSPFTDRAQRGWNTDCTGTILGNGQPARPSPLPITGLTMVMLCFTSGRLLVRPRSKPEIAGQRDPVAQRYWQAWRLGIDTGLD
jgi:hypothetical protein